MDIRLNAEDAYHTVIEWLDVWHLVSWVRREELFTELNVKVEHIFVVLTIDCDEVLWLEGVELSENSLDSRWEDVDATDDEHII